MARYRDDLCSGIFCCEPVNPDIPSEANPNPVVAGVLRWCSPKCRDEYHAEPAPADAAPAPTRWPGDGYEPFVDGTTGEVLYRPMTAAPAQQPERGWNAARELGELLQEAGAVPYIRHERSYRQGRADAIAETDAELAAVCGTLPPTPQHRLWYAEGARLAREEMAAKLTSAEAREAVARVLSGWGVITESSYGHSITSDILAALRGVVS